MHIIFKHKKGKFLKSEPCGEDGDIYNTLVKQAEDATVVTEEMLKDYPLKTILEMDIGDDLVGVSEEDFTAHKVTFKVEKKITKL